MVNAVFLTRFCSGDYLESEVTVRLVGKIARDKIHILTYDVIHNPSVSDRTLDLLEQERTKYQFFAFTTKELWFEHHYASDTLIISE